MSELGIPFRVNVTVIRDNLQYLVDIARLTATMGGRVLNLIAFNPYFEWTSLGNIRFQLRHSEAAPFLKKAIDICNANSIEVNVRYFPICILHGYERHVFTNFQLPYDCHEWDFNSWFDKGIAGSPSREWYYNESNMLRLRHGYVQTEKCAQCSAKTICDGLHMQYVKRWGDDELQPMQASPLEKPTFFIKDQLKVEYMTDRQKTQSDMRMEYNLSLSQFSKEKGNRAGLRG